jgi:hypothetical protein
MPPYTVAGEKRGLATKAISYVLYSNYTTSHIWMR